MLPDLDGVQVVKRLRAADVGVPVLMLTARSRSWRLLAASAALIATFYLLMRSIAAKS
jgi:DNA-binding response OmpR family regulator